MLRKKYKNTEEENSTSKSNATESSCNNVVLLLCQHKLYIALVVRLSSILFVQTYFVPDEYWQSTEVAHRNVFQYGYLTWEWKEKIRSYLYPFLFESFFFVLKLLSFDHWLLVRYGPHILQSVFTAFADVSVYYTSLKVFNSTEVAWYAFILHLSSWFIYYTGSRTLSNTMEMCFVSIASSFLAYERHDERPGKVHRKDHLTLMLIFAGISCIIRPTALFIWLPLLLSKLYTYTYSVTEFTKTVFKVLPIILLLSFGIDHYFYKELVVVQWNFAKFNVFRNLSGFYGSHSFSWYFTQGIPVVLWTHVIFTLIGIFYARNQLGLMQVSLFYILVHSFIAHKEFRFLLPILPFLNCYAGKGLKKLSKLLNYNTINILYVTFILNIIPALYFGLVHQRGVMDGIDYIRKEADRTKNISVLFLMPCHSTPFYSHLHQNVTLKFLTCHPSEDVGYVEEADLFYKNPEEWIKMNILNIKPTHVMTFNALPQASKATLQMIGYKKAISFFHTHLPEGRVGSYIDIYSNLMQGNLVDLVHKDEDKV